MQSSNTNKFTISGGGEDFENRQKSLFDKLNELEATRSGAPQISETVAEDYLQVEIVSTRLKRQNRSETRHLQGQESIFKRPEMPPPWREKNLPDHRKNPNKWTRYSLGDVSQDDMSDRTNTSTALAFLDELRKRKRCEESAEDDDVMDSSAPIRFKKPSSSRSAGVSDEEEEEETCVFRGTKRVMPEYVIGKSNKKSNKKDDKKSRTKKSDKKEVLLNHLMEDEEEESA